MGVCYGKGKKVIPVLLQGAEMHPRLAVLQYLDFRTQRTGPWEELFREIGASGPMPPHQPNSDDSAIARDRILDYQKRNKFKRMRFKTVREKIDPEYDDAFLLGGAGIYYVEHNYENFHCNNIASSQYSLCN